MPGALKHSSCARTSHAVLSIIQGCDLPLLRVLPQDHNIVQFLKPIKFNTLNKMLICLQHLSDSLTYLN